jgi:hypothetical protein
VNQKRSPKTHQHGKFRSGSFLTIRFENITLGVLKLVRKVIKKATNNRYTSMPASTPAGKFALSSRTGRICWHVKYSVALLATEKNRQTQKQTFVKIEIKTLIINQLQNK